MADMVQADLDGLSDPRFQLQQDLAEQEAEISYMRETLQVDRAQFQSTAARLVREFKQLKGKLKEAEFQHGLDEGISSLIPELEAEAAALDAQRRQLLDRKTAIHAEVAKDLRAQLTAALERAAAAQQEVLAVENAAEETRISEALAVQRNASMAKKELRTTLHGLGKLRYHAEKLSFVAASKEQEKLGCQRAVLLQHARLSQVPLNCMHGFASAGAHMTRGELLLKELQPSLSSFQKQMIAARVEVLRLIDPTLLQAVAESQQHPDIVGAGTNGASSAKGLSAPAAEVALVQQEQYMGQYDGAGYDAYCEINC